MTITLDIGGVILAWSIIGLFFAIRWFTSGRNFLEQEKSKHGRIPRFRVRQIYLGILACGPLVWLIMLVAHIAGESRRKR